MSFLRDELHELLEPLGSLRTPADVAAMLRSLGHGQALADHAGLQTALAQASSIVDQLQAIDDDTLESWDGIVRVVKIVGDALTAAKAVDKAVTGSLAPLARDLGQQLVMRIVTLYLRARWPRLHRAASLLTLIAPAETAAPHALTVAGGRITRLPWTDDAFHVDRLGDLMSRPWQTLRDAYLPNGLATAADAHDAAARLFPLLGMAAQSLGLRSFTDVLSLDPRPPLTSPDAIDVVDAPGGSDSGDAASPALPTVVDPAAYLRRSLPRFIMLLPGADGSARLGLSFVVSSAEHQGGVIGVIASVAGQLAFDETGDGWQLTGTNSGAVPAFVFGPNGLELAPFGAPGAGATGRIAVNRIPDGSPAFVIGSATGTRVELGNVRFGVDYAITPARRAIGVVADVDHARIVIAPGDGDGFLRKVLPADGVQLDFNVGVMLSSDRGLDIGVGLGDGALPVLSGTIPVGKSLGPIRIDSLTRDLRPVTTDRGTGVAVSVGVRLSLNLGPIAVTLDGPSVGVDALWALKDATKTPNLGVIDIGGLGLRAPTGVALAVDGALVQGAGALQYDAAKQQYGGALALVVRDKFALDVAGLLTTRMPDGTSGYALLLLGVLRFPPIPIGFGFSINELGALIGINRTANVDALTGALAAGDLDAVLFPRNLAALAAVPEGLGKLFPPKQDAHTIGILAGFTWGSAGLAQIELGVIYDTSAPARIIAIGRVTIERPQIKLHVLALGVLDFDRGELDLQARLVDSRLLGGDLSGDAAVMARWGRDPDLVFSIGGFHPAYKPPTDFTRRFAPLRRVSFRVHTDQSVLRLGLEAYLAVTSSTVQMGARVDFGVTVSAFSIDGMLAFDALIQWDPELYIEAMVRGSVALKIGGTTLFGASVAAQLIGPGDWYVTGKATVSVLWWDVHVGFTIGDKPARPELPAVDGATELAAALTDPRSWSTQATTNGLVSVRRLAAPGGVLRFHPLDELIVRQQIVPLGTLVDRIDAGPLTQSRTFEVNVNVGGRSMQTEPLSDAFARAKYVAMSDSDKLSARSFEQMRSGVRVILDAQTVSAPSIVADWTHEQFVLTPQGLQSPALQSLLPAAAADVALAGSFAGGGVS